MRKMLRQIVKVGHPAIYLIIILENFLIVMRNKGSLRNCHNQEEPEKP